MGLKIPNAVVIPDSKAKMLYGFDPIVLTRQDMTNKLAWFKLALDHDAYLEESDFVDSDTFWRYWFVTLGLLEYSVTLVGGEPGSGKSLVMAFLTHLMVRLFDKKATLDWTPPNPEYFGDFHDLYNEDYQEQLQDAINNAAKLERQCIKEKGRPLTWEEKDALLVVFNAIYGCDECDTWGEKASRTNLTKLVGRLANRRRHFFMSMFLVFVDPTRADGAMIYDNHTHRISSSKDWFFPGYCSYLIEDKRQTGTGVKKFLHLKPERYTHLWHSHNMVSISHEADIYLGGKKRKIPKGKDDILSQVEV